MAAYVSTFSNSTQPATFTFVNQSHHLQPDIHHGIICDSCGANPLRGTRWRCQSCPDHDICNACKAYGSGMNHRFEIVPRTGEAEAVHWTGCKGCGVFPIRGTLWSCRVCGGGRGWELCDPCNNTRISSGSHQHYFDAFGHSRVGDLPVQGVGAFYNGDPATATNYYKAGSAEQQVVQMQAEQAELMHLAMVERQEQQQQQQYGNGLTYAGARRRDKIGGWTGRA